MKNITKAVIGVQAASLLASAQRYYSGEVRTHQPFKYGKFKTRMQGSNQKGTVASLFTFWKGDDKMDWSVAEWNEIDVELVPSKGDNAFYTNLIYKNYAMDGKGMNFDPKDEWHEYEF